MVHQDVLYRLEPQRGSRMLPAGAAGQRYRQPPVLRALDVLIASLALVFFLPLMTLVALLISVQDGGRPIFVHRRIGQDGEKFPCLKFRSMVTDAQARLERVLAADPQARLEWEQSHKLRHDPRITPFGHFLRKSSIDELPQLINVLRGEMSIVGPRPIVDDEVAHYGRRFASYCAVKPGITGLWQVSGRSDTTYRRRVAIDHVFARRAGLGLYVWILIGTAPAVLLRRGSR